MFEPITISYIWDEKTFIEGVKSAYEYELKNSSKRYIGWFFIALLQFGVVAALKKEAFGLLLISTILLIYWYLLRWPLRKAIAIKSFKKSPYANKEFNIKILEDKIIINSNEIDWKDILQIISLENGFLLYIDQEFIFFPAKAFKDIQEKNRFADIAKKKVKNYRK